ncbi:MAG TPA: L-threonylcarbamoyladenylate synthase [Pyrinomonadaceae bacterium]|nr:L-threonylcarbamoyladenylate synthase [Pyrinomonadaceae bacterium]
MASIIKQGGVIAFRTDTFYGLGADPFDVAAVARIRALKGREDDKPILLLISDPGELDRLIVEPSKDFQELAARFWPGPLTIVGKANTDLPEGITAGTGTVGVRLPANETVRDLVRECGGALTATSANPAGRDPARSAEEVRNYFPEGIDLIVDGGNVTAIEPSTVVDATVSPARVVRKGAIPANVIGLRESDS